MRRPCRPPRYGAWNRRQHAQSVVTRGFPCAAPDPLFSAVRCAHLFRGAQREKLKFTVAFLKRFATFIALGTWSGKGSNMNAAVACNLKNAVGFSDGAVVIDFSKLTLSRGRLAKAMAASCLDDGGDKTIRWECAGGGSYDLAVGVAVNTATNETYIQKSVDDIRDNAEMILNLPDSWDAAPVACYIMFQSADLTSVSDSVYAGVIGG